MNRNSASGSQAVKSLIDEQFKLLLSRGFDAEHATRFVWAVVCRALSGGRLDDGTLGAWFDVDLRNSKRIGKAFVDAVTPGVLTVESAIRAFEIGAGRQPGGDSEKRNAGVYYTPQWLASLATCTALRPIYETAVTADDVLSLKICDPAGGGGVFAHAAVKLIVSEVQKRQSKMPAGEAAFLALERCIHLVDIDPIATALNRSLLFSSFGANTSDLSALEKNIVTGDALTAYSPRASRFPVALPGASPDPLSAGSALDWTSAFGPVFDSGGFDVVLGNPPWGAVKPVVREYLAAINSDLLKMQGSALRDHVERHYRPEMMLWEEEKQATKTYARHLRTRCGYEHQGGGDTELYRYFMERCHQLVKSTGRIALIVPSAFQRAQGAGGLRRLFFESGSVEVLLDFLNSQKTFDIHSMFRFLLFVWQGGPRRGVQRAQFGLTCAEDAERALGDARPLKMPMKYLQTVSTSMLIPDVRSRTDADLYRKLCETFPRLGSVSPDSWNVSFKRELDMTNDSRLFFSRLQAESDGAQPDADGSWIHPVRGRLLPLYEGRMVNQYDASAKSYVSGQGRSAVWEVSCPCAKSVRSHYLVSASVAGDRDIQLTARAAFCDVTGHANERTVLAALAPAASICGNKVPTCAFDSADPRIPLIWLAFANSFVVDWIMRRRVSTTLNFFHWWDLPFPRLDPDSDLGSGLASMVSRLSTRAEWSGCHSLEKRAAVRAEIDAIIFEQYDLTALDAIRILDDFPLLDRSLADNHRTVTRDLLLYKIFERRNITGITLSDVGLHDGVGPNVIAERVAWHEANRAVAYVSAELARKLKSCRCSTESLF